MGALKGVFLPCFPYYLYDIFSTNVEICRQNMPSLVLYMANPAAWHGTSTARHYVALPCCLGPPCPTLSPGMALCLLSRAHRHGSPPWSCRPVARREETRSSPSQAVSPRVTNTPSLSHSSAPLHPRMGVEVCSCCAASQLGVLACLFHFRLDVEMRPTRGAGRVLCMRALVH